MIWRSILLLPFALAVTPALAQEDEETGHICVAIRHSWNGDNADARAIETVPVPESYRQRFESTQPCVRFWLGEEDLIDWHLRFGSLASTTAALAYLTPDFLRAVPAPEHYLAELERAWRGAQRDLARAAAITQPEGLDHSVQHRFMDASRPIRRLQTLIGAHQNYLFLATQNLRVAEEFGSLPLLETAERHLRPVLAGYNFLAPLENQSPGGGLVPFNLQTFKTDDLEMRAAILRARLTRSPEAIARAEAAVQAKERPHYARLARQSFSGGDDFCDISEGWGDRETLETACTEDENALQERVVSHLLARATLDLVARPEAARSSNDNVEAALRLLNIERLPDRGRCCGYDTTEDLFRLHLAIAEHQRRLLAGPFPEPGDDDAEQAWSEALDHLKQAERLAPPFQAPGRFRRIAEAWLDIWRRGTALFPREADGPRPPTESPERQRYAYYLERMLAELDAITAETR